MFDIAVAISAAGGTVFGLVSTELVAGIVRRHQRHEKARDDDLAEIVQSIDAVRSLADEYWCATPHSLGARDLILSARMVGALHHINTIISDLFTDAAKRECDVKWFKFYDAAANGDFQEPTRGAEPERLTAIHTTALLLKHSVARERRKLRYKWFA